MTVATPAKEPVIWAREGIKSGKEQYREKDGNHVQWLVDGREAMYEMCEAFCRAKKFIYLIDSYFKPETNLVRMKDDYDRLVKKYPHILDSKSPAVLDVKKLNQEKGFGETDVPLISLLTVMANRGVKVRVVIFHPDDEQDKHGGPFGWLEAWAMVRYFSPCNKSGNYIDLQLAQLGLTKQGHEFGGHHQKSAVVCTSEKRLIGFCGGIDIAENRWALPSHFLGDPQRNLKADPIDNPIDIQKSSKDLVLGEWDGNVYLQASAPGEPPKSIPLWHDVHAKVVGPIAYDLALNFVDRYVDARTKMQSVNARIRAAEDYKKTNGFKGLPPKDQENICQRLIEDQHFGTNISEVALARKTAMLKEIENCKDQSGVSANLLSSKPACYSTGKVWAQILRTYTPDEGEGDYGIWDVYKNLFSIAKKNIYIESQYAFEDENILHVLVDRIKLEKEDEDKKNDDKIKRKNEEIKTRNEAKKKLKVIIVAPLMSDNYDVSIKSNLIELAEASSTFPTETEKCYSELRPEFKKTRAAAYSLQSQFENRRIPIYVHAKLAIVDDEWAIVGSANLDRMGVSHARSWYCRGSSEIAVLIHGEDQALSLRRMLVKEHLGHMAPKGKSLDDFNAVYDAFIEASKANGPARAPELSIAANQDVHVTFHRAYDELDVLEKKRLREEMLQRARERFGARY